MEDENWDNMNAPAYVPDIRNKQIICKTPANLSKKTEKRILCS